MRDERFVVAGALAGIPGVEALGCTFRSRAGPAVPAQRHRDRHAIHLLLAGCQEWSLDARTVATTGGDWLVVPPGTTYHARNALFRPSGILWVQVGPPAWRGLPGLGRALAGQAGRIRASARAQADGRALLDACRRPADDPLRPVAARIALLRLLLTLADDARRPARSADARRLEAALALIEERLAQPLAVRAIARAAGVGPVRLRQLFRQEVGMPPKAWQLHRRIVRAQAALAAGPVDCTGLALDLGFASAQHFADTFRRLVGCAPTRWRPG